MITALLWGYGLMLAIVGLCLVRDRCRKCGRWGLIYDLIERQQDRTIEKQYDINGNVISTETVATRDTELERAECPKCGHPRVFAKTVDFTNFDSPMFKFIGWFLLLTGPIVMALHGRRYAQALLELGLPSSVSYPLSFIGWLVQMIVIVATYLILARDRSFGLSKWGVLIMAWLCIMYAGFDPALNPSPPQTAPQPAPATTNP